MMFTEQDMKAYFDGWLFSIDYAAGRTVSTPVPIDHIPTHKPNGDTEGSDAPVSNNGHRWTETEDYTVISQRSEGRTFREIGAGIGLSQSAVRDRYMELKRKLGIKTEMGRKLKFSRETEEEVASLRHSGLLFKEIGPLVGITREQANELYRRYKCRRMREVA